MPPATSLLFDLSGTIAVVTGGSSGLGRRFATVLAHAGAQVVVAARREDLLDELAAEVAAITPHVADLTIEDERAALIDATIERFGQIDILVNNAGFGRPAPALEEELSSFRNVFELNTVAVFELARLAARHMVPAGSGSIINIASILGMVSASPIPNAAYCASKGAVINLTRELACQWARSGVRVNAIAPGYFPSESTQPMMEDEQTSAFMRRNCPMGRYGKEEELDGVLLFLASDASTYCTGQTIAIDGGWTAR